MLGGLDVPRGLPGAAWGELPAVPSVTITDCGPGWRGRVATVAHVKTFDELYAELTRKVQERPEGSGTVAQIDAGVHAIGKKVVEEAAEVWMAAEYESDEAAAEEISQLLYHVQTMMIARGINLEDVYRHL